jgi:hypothetical protein
MSLPYPFASRIRADAYAVVAAWALMLLCAVLWLLGSVARLPVREALSYAFSAFLIVAAIHVVLAFTHKCPVCSKHPTVQGFKPVHPDSVAQSRLTGWSGVVISVLRRRQLICIHCGTRFDVRP